ncbi:MAG: lamin tail domain-containing protein [Bacteroidota bacterium]|nr:lamin tail domain-containing protein [Bacteroidota bacterium]
MKKLHPRLFIISIVSLLVSFTADAQVVISQVYGGGGNSGAIYRNDFIEIFNRGAASVNLNGWSVQYASSTGSTWAKTNLTNVTIAPGQYYLIQQAAGTGGTTNLPTPDAAGSIAMSATGGKVALVNSITLLTGSCPAAVDFVGYGSANCFEGAAPTPALTNTTAAIRAANGCTDNNINSTDFSTGSPAPRNTVSSLNPCTTGITITTPSPLPAGMVGTAYSVTFTASGGTGVGYVFSQSGGTLPPGLTLAGAVLSGIPTTTAGSPFSFTIRVVDNGSNTVTKLFSLTINPQPCNPPTHTIAEIQGAGNVSPFVGNIESTSGIVTGRRSNGFFMQTPDVDVDANPATSEGIFVFTSSAPPAAAAVGNKVCVTGTITEFIPGTDPNSPSQTEITSPTVTILGTGNALPAAVVLTTANTNPAGGLYQLERFESMRVQANSMTVVAPTQGNVAESSATSVTNGFFYAVITGIARPFREAGVEVPDPLPPGAPVTVTRWDANPELIGIGSNSIGSAAIDVATGAILTNVVGPLDYRSRVYTIDIDPALPPVVSNNGLTFTAVPVQTTDELTVGSFNVERFFDTVNDPGISDPVLTTTAYNNRLNKVSLAIRNVLRSPDIIGMVEVENLTVLQSIATKVNNDIVAGGGANPNYQAYLVEGNDIGGIDVGFLVKPARVNVSSVIQYGAAATYTDPTNSLPALLNDRPPLVLNGTFTKPGCTTPNAVTVIVNHLRSLNGVDDVGSNGVRVRAKRKAQAEYLANLIQGFQTTDPAANIISVGDFNAFEFSDGYVDLIGTITGVPTPAPLVVSASTDLVNPDLVDLVNNYPAPQRYSYSFSGSAQVLDHVLVNSNLSTKISRFSIARLDADFPEVYRSDPNRPERISDHDAPVAYILFTDEVDPVASCKPFTVTLSNGSATIAGADVNNGSTDDCGPVTLSVSPSAFNCSNIGNNNVTLTVTDGAGNTSTCVAVVTVVGVVPSCTITAIPANAVYTGGVPTTIYLGYGPQSVTLNVSPSGGAPFTYSWTGSNLSCLTCAAPVFTPVTEGVYQFTVTVTNTYGCTTTCSITICVLDIRVPGTNGKKVYLSHAPPGNPANCQTLSVNTNAVNAHLVNHPGDRLGKCGQDPCGNQQQMITINGKQANEEEISLQVSALPNPSSSEFTLSIGTKSFEPVTIRILDVHGGEVSKQINLSAGSSTIKVGSNLKTGFYFAEINQGTERKVVKLVKL